MATREELISLLEEFASCIPKQFCSTIENSQKGMGFILVYLEKSKDQVYAGDLARELNVSTARIAALLKKMECKGLITRYPSAHDARKTVVTMTEKGSLKLKEMEEEMFFKAESVLNRVGKDDLKEFLRILHLIKEVIEDCGPLTSFDNDKDPEE